MLAFLAAAIPIVASLYVAGSMLIEYTRAGHEARVYARIRTRFQTKIDSLDMSTLGAVEYDRQREIITKQRRLLLEQNGIDPTIGTAAGFDRSHTPQAPKAEDLRRQWVLLTGSVVGIILVSVDVATL